MTSYHHSDQGKGIHSAHVTFVAPQPDGGYTWKDRPFGSPLNPTPCSPTQINREPYLQLVETVL
ncbi:hypothetical protein [Fictibacillus enclensis]|uniref:hypothetical protein n=1 Tax=Fictibacillus enclensis TaxID=1017270 RepID=UPI0025A15501|nr:hypothetical protein [Fictibacillus enclensis]